MPYTTIGRDIVRGTITRDRWRVEVVLACDDRLVVGERTPLFLHIAWRGEEPAAPSQPEDAAPIVLRLRSLTPQAGGAVRFDHPEGAEEQSFAGNTTALLSLYGKAASAGETHDIALDVIIEGKDRGCLPLSVAAAGVRPGRLALQSGGGDPITLLPHGRSVSYGAIIQPAQPGQIHWRAFPPGHLDIQGASDTATIAVVASDDTTVERWLLAWFVSAADKTWVAALPVASFDGVFNPELTRVSLPDLAQVGRAGWTTNLANPEDTVELWVEVSGGQVGQKLTIEIQSVTASGNGIPLELLELPLENRDRIIIPWQVPAAIPTGSPEALSFTASVLDQPVASADAQIEHNGSPLQLYAQLQLQAIVQVQLTDTNNRPLANVAYQLTDLEGNSIAGASGTTGADGEVLIPDLPSTEYILQVERLTVLSAEESPLEVSRPETDNVVFSFLDVRPSAEEVRP
ncbi:MAG: hypothetical protein ACFB2W_25680 [Leptolyngbyaceae cyanobacterium]